METSGRSLERTIKLPLNSPSTDMTPEQRKRAILSALVLAAAALGIYLTVMLKVFVSR